MSTPSSPSLPRWGRVAGLGRVRILEYLGNDRFLVLDSRDRRWVRHRKLIIFTKR